MYTHYIWYIYDIHQYLEYMDLQTDELEVVAASLMIKPIDLLWTAHFLIP